MLALLVTAAVIAAVVGVLAHTRWREEKPTVGMVKALARCRPLGPWPWREWEQFCREPDRLYERRQKIWEHFAAQPRTEALVLDWYDGLRLEVQLGNELSRGLFVVGAFEANEFAFLDRYLQPGMVFVDAGAHEGLYSVFAARRTGPEGRVYAIEPSERERAACERNLELNGLTATMIPCAVAGADGEAEFLLAQDHRSGHNTLGAFAWEGVHVDARRRVVVRSFDSLAAEYGWERVDFLKMDIEGAETAALRGGGRVFRELRPVVLVEVSPRSLAAQGSSREELLATFEELGYELYHFDYGTGLLRRGAEGQTGDNLVAVPKEMASPAGFEPALSP